ncbi:MAG: hypothetical protein NC184_07665 [Roseburia sp.]|nr:hypothetical protein [Roseburia sp.]
MAYTSDLRGKNILTDIDIEVRKLLSEGGISCDLEFRVFDESDEDALLWENGGLCFKDPVTNMNLGSNDAGWFLNGKPIFIVEATFGTERGQFGDGQLNRISHSLGPALNGIYGITMVPFKGQSFVTDGYSREISSDNIKYSIAYLHKSMALFSLRVSKKYAGKYLIMDPYEPHKIRDMLFNVIKKELGFANELEELTTAALNKVRDYVGGYVYGGRSNQFLPCVHFTNGEIGDDIARFYSHNLESLTTSSKRDGHGLLGKNLIEMYLAKDRSTAIFIRLDDADFEVLRQRRSKEFMFITSNPRIQVYNFDDLFFEDENLRRTVIAFRRQNLHINTEKSLMKTLQQAFISGEIKVIKNRKK